MINSTHRTGGKTPEGDDKVLPSYSHWWTGATVLALVVSVGASIMLDIYSELPFTMRLGMIMLHFALPWCMLGLLCARNRWHLGEIRLCVAATATVLVVFGVELYAREFISDWQFIQSHAWAATQAVITGCIFIIMSVGVVAYLWHSGIRRLRDQRAAQSAME